MHLLNIETYEKVEWNVRLEAGGIDAEQLENLNNNNNNNNNHNYNNNNNNNNNQNKTNNNNKDAKQLEDLPLLLCVDEDKAVKSREEEVEDNKDDQVVVDQFQHRAPGTQSVIIMLLF